MLLGDRGIKRCHGALLAKIAFQKIAKAIRNLCLSGIKAFFW